MNSRDLKKVLKENGCVFIRHGKGDHEVWHSPITGRNIIVPHPKKDLGKGIVKAILRDAGI